jgi:hypothetical protein
MQNVVGMFDTRTEAETAIHRLKETGIAPESISIAMKDVRDSGGLAETTGAHDLSGEAATAGAVSGATVGTLVGLSLVGSTFVLPGLGTFLIGGPLAAALAGAGIGAASGGLLGALIGSGIPEAEAEHYAAGIGRGQIVLSTNVPDTEAPVVRKIFDEEGSRRTHSIGLS